MKLTYRFLLALIFLIVVLGINIKAPKPVSLDPVALFGFALILCLLILYLGFTYWFVFRRLGRRVRSRPIPRPNLDPIKNQQQFYTVFDDKTVCKIFQPGTRDPGWRPCQIRVYPEYVAFYIGSRWHKITLTFNTQNIMWLGHIQHIDETVNEICLDLDVDDVWYTVWVRMSRSDIKEFAAALEQILPGELLFKRNRYQPNIRHQLIKSHRIDVKTPNRRRIDEPSQLYLTPRYLVVLTHTFVSRVISIDSIESFKMEAIDESSNDYRILQLITDNGVENFVVEHNLDFESRLQQLVH